MLFFTSPFSSSKTVDLGALLSSGVSDGSWPHHTTLSYTEVPVTSALQFGSVHPSHAAAALAHHAATQGLPGPHQLTVAHHPGVSHAAAAMSHAATAAAINAATMQAMHAQIPPAHLVAASPAMSSPVGSSSGGSGGGGSNHHQQNQIPCSTLFVANLGQFVSEQELKDAFSR